jgi:RNase H-like domain found in reverse transcriptase/Reverse transcriptase (RNA-dependent DNA polymerase)/Integrase zinc binding domain/PHD-finger/Integrase core domain
MELDWRGQRYAVTCTEAPPYDPLYMHTSAAQVAPDPLSPLTYSFSFPSRHVEKASLHAYIVGKLPTLLGCTFLGGDIEYTRKAVKCAFSFVPLNSDLSPAQQQALQTVLEKYHPAFSSGPDDIGNVNSPHHVEHIIRVKEDATPACTSRPMTSFSEREREFIESQVKLLLNLGVIKPSHSPWMSAPVCVKKHDKTLRLCIDFRPLNAVTVPDPYPLPVIEHLLTRMSKAQYFSCMDIVSAFWQVPMESKSTPYTGFRTHKGNFEWVRMPFGLVNASSTFQRLMDEILGDLEFAAAYLDDVFIFSSTWEEHLQHISIVLERLLAYNVKLKLVKCIFGATSIKCLGHVVGGGKVVPDPEKLAAIVNMPEPLDLKMLRSFIGMASYYRQYIENFALIVAPLSRLTRKNVPFIWDEECIKAFNTLKEKLTTEPVLRLPDFKREFILTTDWSKIAIGAVLSQIDPETGFDHPVAFASRLLNDAERNYSPTEGELLALIWAVDKFRLYLDGRKFTAYTDHHALEWLASARYNNSKLERWALRLQEYNFEVKYKKGEENLVADCLSRCLTAKCLTTCLTTMTLQACALSSQWPDDASNQKTLDQIPCTVCGDPEGHDNLVICEKCNRLFHLRCLVPPQSTVPTGPWMCPACDPFFIHGGGPDLAELRDDGTYCDLSPHDPYADHSLLDYVCSGHNLELLTCHPPKRALDLRRRGSYLKQHPSLPGWLLVYKKIRGDPPRWLVCPPPPYRWDVIRMFHDMLGHAGVEQTLKTLHVHFHWPGIKADISLFVSCCTPCQKLKLEPPVPPPLQPPVIYGPLRHVHIDLAGPFVVPKTQAPSGVVTRGEVKAWIVLMVDYFTKVAEFVAVFTKEPTAIAKAFWDGWVCRYGAPTVITTDNGLEFETDFKHMVHRLGIKHIHTSVQHPASNGAVERLVKTLKRMLTAHFNDNPTNWLLTLPHMRLAYMSRTHSTLGVSPNEMLFGFRPDLPLAVRGPVLLALANTRPNLFPSDHMQLTRDRREELYSRVQVQLRQQYLKTAAQHARRYPSLPHSRIVEGDLVWDLGPSKGALHTSVRGPFLVVSVSSSGTHATLSTGSTQHRDAKTFQRHLSQLVKCQEKPA